MIPARSSQTVVDMRSTTTLAPIDKLCMLQASNRHAARRGGPLCSTPMSENGELSPPIGKSGDKYDAKHGETASSAGRRHATAANGDRMANDARNALQAGKRA